LNFGGTYVLTGSQMTSRSESLSSVK